MRLLIKGILKFPANHPKKWLFFRNSVLASPVAILGFVRFDFGQPEPAVHSVVATFFRNHHYLTMVLLFAIVPISLAFDVGEWVASYLKDKERDHSPGLELARTLAALTQIIGVKMERLGVLAKDCVRGNAGTVSLQEATSPEEQVKEIVKQLWMLLVALCETQRIKLTLVSTFDPNQYSFAAFAPQAEQPPNVLLTSRSSFIRHVAETKGFHCIQDIAKHIKWLKSMPHRKRDLSKAVKYLETEGGFNSGSICGFPIYDRELDKIVYVLTVYHDQPRKIKAEFAKTYGDTLNHFFHRLVLEHRVKIIRDYGNKSTN